MKALYLYNVFYDGGKWIDAVVIATINSRNLMIKPVVSKKTVLSACTLSLEDLEEIQKFAKKNLCS